MPDGTTRPSASLRVLRTIGYALIGLAGTLLILSPIFPPEVGTGGTVMAWFLAVGGGLSALGTATNRWVGEFMGLPLLGVSFLVFALLSADDGFEEAPYIVAANVSLLAGLALLMFARWRSVLAVFHLADKFSGRRLET
jgi:hypothetical protein